MTKKKPLPPLPRRRLKECACAGISSPIGAGTNLVENVKILGLISKNGRQYLTEAVRKATSLYEGIRVNIDHLTASGQPSATQTPFLARFGRFEQVHFVEGDGLRGNLRFNGKHIYAETFRGWLETDPSAIGFSHDATGKVREAEDGSVTVIEIEEVHSVDLVADPATTQGLFESITNRERTTVPTPTKKPAVKPGKVTKKKVKEMAGCDGDNMDKLDEGLDMEPGAEGYEAHVGNLVNGIMNDASLDQEAKKKKILHALKLLDEEEPVEEAEDDETPEEDPEEESYSEAINRLRDEVKSLTETVTKALKVKPAKSTPAGGAPSKPLTVDELIAALESPGR